MKKITISTGTLLTIAIIVIVSLSYFNGGMSFQESGRQAVHYASDSTSPSPAASSSALPSSSSSGSTSPSSSAVLPSQLLKVSFIDVGQGDSILIEVGSSAMLIDAGTAESADSVLDYLNQEGIKKLDYCIATHPHEDHIGGMDNVIREFSIGTFIAPKVTASTKNFNNMIQAVKARKLSITAPTSGQTYTLGTGAAFTILAPNSEKYESLNNYSVAIRLTYGKNSFLFSGDAEHASTDEMRHNNTTLIADVYKLGHHGSADANTAAFLNAIEPKYAVLTCATLNNYGHPHKEPMKYLEQKHIPLYRTNESGTIVCTSDGTNITFNTAPGSYARGKNTPKGGN